MRLFNRNFYHNNRHFWMQSAIVIAPIFAMLLALDYFTRLGVLGVVGATSLASSSCNIVVAPDAATCSPRHLIGGYFLAFVFGIVTYYLAQHTAHYLPGIFGDEYHSIYGALGAGMCVFLMMLFDFVHPSATGLCVALIIERWDTETLVVIGCFVILLAILRHFLKGKLIKLI